MNILNKIEIIEPYPALYIKELDAIVISDLHLGYEGIMAEQGILVPKIQFKKEMRVLTKIMEMRKASTIIIAGDVKHEFSETTYHEFKEVRDLFEFLKTRYKRVIVIKGNHDNYLFYITRRYDVELYDQLVLGDFLFIHGDVVPGDFGRAGIIIMGHEHTAIALFDEVGGKEKIKAFLLGDLGKGKVLVMPAFSPLAYGTEINLIPREEILSPVLKELVDVDKLWVIGIDEETGCLDFGELGKLRRV